MPRSTQGLTLVEVAVVISVLGMLLAVALPTLSRTVQPSKMAEASEQLEALYRATAAYYAEPRSLDSAAHPAHCLPAPAGPTPSAPSPDPVVVDFAHGAADDVATWKALGFAPSVPLRFRYAFLPAAHGCELAHGSDPLWLTLRAEADLDGDGVYSRFERRIEILRDGQLRPEAVLHIADRVE